MALIDRPDTNAWIGYLRGKDVALVHRFLLAGPSNLRLSSVVLGELLYGAYHAPASYLAHNLGLIAAIPGVASTTRPILPILTSIPGCVLSMEVRGAQRGLFPRPITVV